MIIGHEGVDGQDQVALQGAAKKAFKMSIQDSDGDGNLTGNDLQAMGIKAGSAKAKAAWQVVEAQAKASKMYAGKPLAPGVHVGDGDHQFLVDRLIWSQGLSPESAAKVAGSVAAKLRG